MKTFRIAIWDTEYKKAYIDAKSEKQARKIAQESLDGYRSNVGWESFDSDRGIGDVEQV